MNRSPYHRLPMLRRLPILCLALLSACSDATKEQPDNAADGSAADTSADGSATASGDTSTDGSGSGEGSAEAPQLPPPGPLSFGPRGSLTGAAGRGSFAFGAATAATQIEDQNPATDWFTWTAPEGSGGLGKGTFVGDAVRGYSKANEDIALLQQMNLDDYRFSMEWARIEPTRDTISEEALVHYDQLLDGLLAANIRPNVTIHHFSGPVWTHDPRDAGCANGPSDTNLCGWSNPDASELIAELAEHAALLAQRYGGKVDNWATLNEPFNYILASYGFGVFPPGQSFLLSDWDRLVATYRNFAAAHVAIYNAIKANDTIDADGDGIAASVGLTLSVIAWQPARNNQPSNDPADIAAAARMDYAYNIFFAKAVYEGGFDSDLDGTFDEQLPEWQGKLDWLGLQYYFSGGVTARTQAIRQLALTPCYPPIDFGSCIRPEDNTHWVPEMRYAFWEPGLYDLLMSASRRWPDLPLIVSESGLATHEGQRRAEHVTRSLEQIHRAITDGADVRGYYHWSLTDNFEWAEGFGPRFGLYTVDYTTYARTPTAGATTLGEIAAARTVTEAQRALMGGLGPMTPEPPLP